MKKYLWGLRSLALGAVTAGIALAGLPATSSAALISGGACDNSSLSQPFANYGDSNEYKLVTGGNFEGSLSGWTLSGGARVINGGNPNGSSGHSLYLPAGASVTTPFTCVNAAYPSFRLFARNDSLLSTIVPQVVYKLPLLGNVALPIGAAALSPNWSPTLPLLTASLVTGLLNGGTAEVALKFTAALGPSEVDDIYVDPLMRR
ncbi:MAG TPA: hypothetical protein VGN29_15680 [Solirubrobacteraceae bacterium]|nr:hypothetical protein [Solirubrobacteraceae bacterium]